MKRIFLTVIGVVSVALGVVGIFLPLLPTTPFLLLAAACFVRSSPRLYSRLINHPRVGSYIRNFREKRALPLRVKIVSVSVLWLTIGASATFVVGRWWVRILLFAVAAAVTVHILSYATLTGDDDEQTE